MPTLAEAYAKKYAGTAQANLAPEYSGKLASKPINEAAPIAPRQNALQQVASKVTSVAKQTANIAGQGLSALGSFAVHSAQDVVKTTRGTIGTLSDLATYPIRAYNNEQTAKILREKLKNVTRDYAAGRMSKDDYHKSVKDINVGFDKVNKSAQQIATSRTVGERNLQIAETTANILSFGSLGLAEVGGKQALQAGSKEAIAALIDDGAVGVEKFLLKFPAAKTLVARNLEGFASTEAKQLAGETTAQFLTRESRSVASSLLIKRPVFYESNIGQARSAYDHLLKGDYKGALTDSAWLGIQMLDGGPLGAASKLASWGKTAGGKLFYGKGSFIDQLSMRIGDGNSTQVARFIETTKNKAPTEYKDVERAFRVFQESNLRMAGEDVNQAVDNFLRTYTDAGVDLTKVTPSQLYKDMKNWHDADTLWSVAAKSGLLHMGEDEASRYTPVRWDATTRNAVADAIRTSGGHNGDWLDAVNNLAGRPGSGFGSNNNLMLQIQKVVSEATSAEDAARAIQAIDAAVGTPDYIPRKLAKQMAALGYTMAAPVGGRINTHLDLDDTRKLVSSAIKDPSTFDSAVAPQPALNAIADLFQQAGVSPQEANTSAMRKLGESVSAHLGGTNVAQTIGLSAPGDRVTGGQVILSKLQQFIENKPSAKVPIVGSVIEKISAGKSALTDIRQMTLKEISEALGSTEGGRFVKLSEADAKQVRQAIVDGYRDIPLEIRGLGDKVTDTLYGINPLQKYYSRIQGAFRYTYNPFFRAQESVETKLLSHGQATNLLWGKSREELDTAVRILEENRVLSSTLSGGGAALPGEAAADQVLGRISANLTGGQKRDLAGLALDIANHQGRSLDEMAKTSPEVIDDALRIVVQYPRKGALSSPLARTLNLVFFPVRYNAKVTLVAAQALAKQPPSIQKAVFHSLFNLKDWLKSDEGIRWQSTNADAIALLNWITPINSIQATMNLLSHRPNSVADLGQLGGLPLGIISQVLDGQGIVNLNKPYVQPSSGDVFPKYVPQTAKARTATALADLLNSMFTYPGRTLGLPGKSESIRSFVSKFIATDGKDFDKQVQDANLTPLQQKWVQVLKGDTSNNTIDSLYHSPAQGEFNWYTLPPMSLPYKVQPLVNKTALKPRTGLPSKAKGKKAKPIATPITGR